MIRWTFCTLGKPSKCPTHETGKADLHLCCRVYIACRHQCTRWLQLSGAGAAPARPGGRQGREGWSHCHGTGSETRGTRVADKPRAPGPGVPPEAHSGLGTDCRAAGREQLPGCRSSSGSGSAGTGGSSTTVAASAASEAAGQCQFVKVECMALFHIHTFLDRWDFCFCFWKQRRKEKTLLNP